MKFGFLKKKYGPLPGWAWSAISAIAIYLIYRHFQNKGGGDTGQPSAMALGTDQGQQAPPSAPGDLTSNSIPDNAANDTSSGLELGDRNLASKVNDFVGQILDQAAANAADAVSQNDNSQNNPTDTGTSNATATPGLTHIFGDYWWDIDQHKLIRIPGSGGTTKGSGKKPAPSKEHGGRRNHPVKTPSRQTGRISTRHSKAPIERNSRSPAPRVTHKQTPKPQDHTVKLTPVQRRAIDAAHHPESRNVRPINKPRRQPRQLPKRPTERNRGRG